MNNMSFSLQLDVHFHSGSFFKYKTYFISELSSVLNLRKILVICVELIGIQVY